MSDVTQIEAEDKKVATQIGLYVLRSVNLILAAICTVGVLWIKANVPSKDDFKELHIQIRALEISVAQLSETNERMKAFDERIRRLEQIDGRRGPPPPRGTP